MLPPFGDERVGSARCAGGRRGWRRITLGDAAVGLGGECAELVDELSRGLEAGVIVWSPLHKA